MADNRRRVGGPALRGFVGEVFQAAGMAPEHAATVAEILVWANLRGVDSHGVLRVPRYLNLIDQGLTNPRPDLRVVSERAAVLTVEGDRGPGAVVMSFAMDRAIEKAREAGIGWALARNTTHAGAVGFYTLKAAQQDMAGIVVMSSRPNMVYHGARAAGVATSPLAIAAPGHDHPPLMLDMATGVVAWGKIAHARDSGQPIPADWAMTADGESTTDAAKAAIPMPLGGPKGAGMALMFEVLTSVLAGVPLISDALLGVPGGTRHKQNGVAVAIDIAAFTDIAAFKLEIDRLAEALKTLPRADGIDEIMAPGERGDRVLTERTRDGIPLAPGTWDRLAEVATDLGLSLPETL